jgi:hypothetical protein
VFEALEGFPAAFGQTFVLGGLVVAGNAAATAHNILANETLYRFSLLLWMLIFGVSNQRWCERASLGSNAAA